MIPGENISHPTDHSYPEGDLMPLKIYKASSRKRVCRCAEVIRGTGYLYVTDKLGRGTIVRCTVCGKFWKATSEFPRLTGIGKLLLWRRIYWRAWYYWFRVSACEITIL